MLITDNGSKRIARGMSQQLKRSHQVAARRLQSNDYNLTNAFAENLDNKASLAETQYILDRTNLQSRSKTGYMKLP